MENDILKNLQARRRWQFSTLMKNCFTNTILWRNKDHEKTF